MLAGSQPRARLIRQLQRAYSGELAAALAYAGHWRSLSNVADRSQIRRIEHEEWHHRRLVGEMLRNLGSRPQPLREVRACLIGSLLAVLCFVAGRYLPMYGAGKLESRNIGEYEDAAQHSVTCGRIDLAGCLLTMAEVEWDHEAYFRAQVESHSWRRWFPVWPPVGPKSAIRTRHSLDRASKLGGLCSGSAIPR
jgi:rubrerythrin